MFAGRILERLTISASNAITVKSASTTHPISITPIIAGAPFNTLDMHIRAYAVDAGFAPHIPTGACVFCWPRPVQ
jgi:hypothetical protein